MSETRSPERRETSSSNMVATTGSRRPFGRAVAEGIGSVERSLRRLINPSDDLTKALVWTPHARHSRHAMGLCGPPLAPLDWASDHPQSFDWGRVPEAGEGVGA